MEVIGILLVVLSSYFIGGFDCERGYLSPTKDKNKLEMINHSIIELLLCLLVGVLLILSA